AARTAAVCPVVCASAANVTRTRNAAANRVRIDTLRSPSSTDAHWACAWVGEREKTAESDAEEGVQDVKRCGAARTWSRLVAHRGNAITCGGDRRDDLRRRDGMLQASAGWRDRANRLCSGRCVRTDRAVRRASRHAGADSRLLRRAVVMAAGHRAEIDGRVQRESEKH